jgi:hypothetical protein
VQSKFKRRFACLLPLVLSKITNFWAFLWLCQRLPVSIAPTEHLELPLPLMRCMNADLVRLGASKRLVHPVMLGRSTTFLDAI